MSDQSSIVASVDGRIGRLLLNRPRALNALDLPMIRALTASLVVWRDDPAIHAVLIEGAGGRGFCAGGDIRAIRDAAVAGDAALVETFFAEEYSLNRMIAEYPKPYIAAIDGICMGGGIGVAVHGAIRIATEAAVFAMPETAIGLFPDIGASYVLPRLPGQLGLYLGLTGARVTGADAVHAGLATHYVARDDLPALTATIAADGAAAVAGFARTLPPFSLAGARPAIDRCFAARSVGELRALLAEAGDWGEATTALLRAASPSALLWSFGLIRLGAARNLAACLDAELRLTRAVTRHADFAEGVRAMIIDKDRTPNWAPALDGASIQAMLAA